METQNRAAEWKRDVPAAPAETVEDGGPEEEPFDEEAWRAGLKLDDRLDAQDSDRKWFESIVVEVNEADDKLKIHFRGWASKWDSWFKRSSVKLQPRFTKVKDFRDFRVNDKIEYKHHRRWFEATVTEVKADRTEVKLKSKTAGVAGEWVEWDSEMMCALGTHCAKHKVTNYYDFRKSRAGRPVITGAVGLQNLGTTLVWRHTDCLAFGKVLTFLLVSMPCSQGTHAS